MNNHATIRDTIETAAHRAVDYWGTESDEEAVILAGLECGGLNVLPDDFRIMVEALVAIEEVDSSRDLSAYGGPWNASLSDLADFADAKRSEYDSTLGRVVDANLTADVVPFPVRALQAA